VVSKMYIIEGSVATQLRGGGMLNITTAFQISRGVWRYNHVKICQYMPYILTKISWHVLWPIRCILTDLRFFH